MHFYFTKEIERNSLRGVGGYFTLKAAGSFATGLITFIQSPNNGDTITLSGVVFTFYTSPPEASPEAEVLIGTATQTRDNLLAKLQASVDASVAAASYTSQNANGILITYKTTGAAGNDFSLETTSNRITFSGGTLTGGS